jgi:hypothetical protein
LADAAIEPNVASIGEPAQLPRRPPIHDYTPPH